MRTRIEVAFAALCLACSADYYSQEADREVASVLYEADQKALADRRQWVEQPEELIEAGSTDADGSGGLEEGDEPIDPLRLPRLELDLPTALEAGFTTARDYLTREEGLYIAGLGLTLTRFDFGPQLDSTISYLWSDSEDGSSSNTTRADLGVSQILETGGTFAIDTSLITNGGGTREWDSAIDFSLDQPLLRGAGYSVAWERLTQAERDILYAVRDFELFRQDFTIGILADYFNLISQRIQLGNTRANYENAVYDRERSEALRAVERIGEQELIQARRREVTSRNDLIVAQTDFNFDVDAFRIRLGLPEADEVVLGEELPPFSPVRLDADSAVQVALANRLDLMTARERSEDTGRRVSIARNALLPDVDLGLDYGLSDTGRTPGNVTPPEDWAARAQLVVELPLQRLPERNTYRTAVILYEQAVRDYELLLQNTERDVRNALRELDQLEEQIALAEQQIAQDERGVAINQIRYEAGELGIRDLLEARQSLLNGQNGLIQVQVRHFIARLRLYRELGLLFIDERGNWST